MEIVFANEGFLSLFIIFIGVIIIVTFVVFNDKKYEKFVKNHSISYLKIKDINRKYHFESIKPIKMSYRYDNEDVFNDLRCEDYLTYNLGFVKEEVKQQLKISLNNKNQYVLYEKEIEENCKIGIFDETVALKNTEKLISIEKKLILEEKIKSVDEFTIEVELILSYMNGDYRKSKWNIFKAPEIKNILNRLEKKRGDFYLDSNIWDSLCKIERSKVSNKLRLEIFRRDGNRCKMCGKRTDDLEIDHIIPISKGGKSNKENLQTLCRKCNRNKGSNI